MICELPDIPKLMPLEFERTGTPVDTLCVPALSPKLGITIVIVLPAAPELCERVIPPLPTRMCVPDRNSVPVVPAVLPAVLTP